MKNINLFLTILLTISQFSFAQKLFTAYNLESDHYNKMLKNNPDLDLDKISASTMFYMLNQNSLDQILKIEQQRLEIHFPFFHDQTLSVDLDLFDVNSGGYTQINRYTDKGLVQEMYKPSIKTYRIQKNDLGIRGVFIFSHKGIKAVFNLDQKTYQIDAFNTALSDSIYFITKVQDNPIKFNFECGSNSLIQYEQQIHYNSFRSGNAFGCIELAIEIDHYTFQTFGTYQASIDWAMEMLAVASAFYLDAIGVELKSNFAQVWEIDDPYALFVEEPNDMLFAIRDHWNNQDDLVDVNRDVVHLFSRRNNTGTGGIAFLNGVNSFWNGYGFSSNLTDNDSYAELPAPYFFWNIYCLMHELGHNFGAKHTQWCGWPEGPIDNCVNIESIFPEECSEYVNNPSAEIGTIMSYCHMWPIQSGGGIIMKFHETVKNTIIAYLAMQDLDDCEDSISGCMDANACNYNMFATASDNNCNYAEQYYDCDGNCLNDADNNNICDEQESVSTTEFNNEKYTIYPNPSNNYITIRVDNLFVELQLLNALGQVVLYNPDVQPSEKIDVSSMSSGLYTAYLITESKIIKENIIIQ